MEILENKTDEELAFLAQNGNSKATEILILRCKGLVKMATRSFFLIGAEVEDLLQEGMIGVFKAINDFNQKSSFKSFANLCIKRNVISAIKRSTRGKHKPLNNYISLTESGGDNPDNIEIIVNSAVIDPETDLLNKESEKELNVKIKELLSDFEYEILFYYLKGYSYIEIGEKIKKTPKSVDNALQRIKKKLESYLKK